MDLTHEALELIQETAVEAAAPKLLQLPGDDRRAWVAIKGTLVEHPLPPPRKKHQVFSVRDLARLAAACPQTAAVWHNHHAVVLQFDRGDGRDHATLILDKTRVWAAVEKLEGRQFTQEDLVSFLRIDLAGQAPAEVLAAVRNVKFSASTETASDLQHASHTLGNSVELQVSGARDLPEQFRVRGQVYRNAIGEFWCDVAVGLDVLHGAKKFRLTVLGDQVANVLGEAQAEVANELREELQAAGAADVPVYWGSA